MIVVAVEMLDLEIAAVVEWAFAKAGCHRVGFRSIAIGAALIFPVPSSSPSRLLTPGSDKIPDRLAIFASGAHLSDSGDDRNKFYPQSVRLFRRQLQQQCVETFFARRWDRVSDRRRCGRVDDR
ncbi:hypothetical protein [Mesorhizobium sp. L48C026A00]|uniref:hypothetical protein n=1 Tax=Mesorhizobium sp. L48C026A00 TaxID=1287182 RepID=UPI0018DEB493|nr:hypothetical protein [Mesorhizobium sp. L48C026A00]